jgi:hypothetical protein
VSRNPVYCSSAEFNGISQNLVSVTLNFSKRHENVGFLILQKRCTIFFGINYYQRAFKQTNAKLMLLNSTSVFNTKKSRVSCMNLLLRFPYTQFRTRNSTEFRGIIQNSVEVKPLPQKIPYSAEFQKVTN